MSILAGFANQSSPDQPTAVLPFHGTEPPPLISRVVQLPRIMCAPSPPPAAADAAAVNTSAAVNPQPQPHQASAALAAVPRVLPGSAAPFHTLPATPGLDAAGFYGVSPVAGASGSGAGGPQFIGGFGNSFGANTGRGGGGGGGGLLFSVGAGAGAGVGTELLLAGGSGGTGARKYKRPKPNDWLYPH